MQTHIVQIGAHRSALIVAISGALLMIPFMLLYLPIFLFLPAEEGGGLFVGVIMLLLVPPLYFVFGYLVTGLWLWLINLVAGRLGGFPVTLAGTAAPDTEVPHGA